MQSCCISAVMVNKHPQLRSLGLLLLFALSTGLISEYPALTYYHKGHKGSTPNRIQSSQQQQTQQQLCHDISFRRRYRQLFSSYDAQAKITSQAHQPSEDGDEVSHPQEEEGDDDDIEYTQGDEDDTDSIDGEDDFMSVDSPLSQLPPEEFATRYPRDEWLDAATEKMFDTESFPLGSLSEEDVETTAGLMVAWVRRRSVEAALTVERLLKRIVDDMRAGNKSIHVTTRIYTIVSYVPDSLKFLSLQVFSYSRIWICRQ